MKKIIQKYRLYEHLQTEYKNYIRNETKCNEEGTDMMEHMQNLETNINMNNLPNYTYTENQNKKISFQIMKSQLHNIIT